MTRFLQLLRRGGARFGRRTLCWGSIAASFGLAGVWIHRLLALTGRAHTLHGWCLVLLLAAAGAVVVQAVAWAVQDRAEAWWDRHHEGLTLHEQVHRYGRPLPPSREP
jgi:hypothetical protein